MSKLMHLVMMLLVLIVPLWNWNSFALTAFCCTGCFNRTFMELKSYSFSGIQMFLKVLIVPLWNWNLRLSSHSLRLGFRFNRTFMELKYLINAAKIIAERCFNRTFMELKWLSQGGNCWWIYVLIVPLWNWNWNCQTSSIRRMSFNRTFMELKCYRQSVRLTSRMF